MRLSPFALIDRWLAPPPAAGRVAWLRGQVFAHRGLHGEGRAENSPGAFAAAIAQGLGIECDIQLSADGVAMVFHDARLDRLTGESGPVTSRMAHELGKVALGGSTDTIPTLRQLLGQVAGRVPLLIEVKSSRSVPIGAICLAVSTDMAGYEGAFAVMSFDPRVPRWFLSHSPATLCGLVQTEESAKGWRGRILRHLALWQARPDFLAYDIRDLPSRFAAAQRRRGLPVASWTVRSPALLARAREYADAPIAEGNGLP